MARWRLFCRRIHLVQSLRQQFFDAGTGIVHGEEIPREVSPSVSQFPAIGSVCLKKQTYILHVVDRHVGKLDNGQVRSLYHADLFCWIEFAGQRI
jgi:hypothetical protein